MLSSILRSGKRSARNSYARDPVASSYPKSTRHARNNKMQPSTPSQLGGKMKALFVWGLGLSLGAVLLLGLGVGGLQLHRLATTSDFFAIRRIEIRGATH
ncbi:MAG: hypothetical protein RRY20_06730, partial [Bilophila sp.]